MNCPSTIKPLNRTTVTNFSIECTLQIHNYQLYSWGVCENTVTPFGRLSGVPNQVEKIF